MIEPLESFANKDIPVATLYSTWWLCCFTTYKWDKQIRHSSL